MKKLLIGILAGATVLSGFTVAQTAAAQPGYGYRDHGRYGGGYRHSPRYYGGRHYYRDRGDTATAAIAGALIGSAIVAGSSRDRYYDGGSRYYDRGTRYGYYDRGYRCRDREVWDPYYGGYIVRRVCR